MTARWILSYCLLGTFALVVLIAYLVADHAKRDLLRRNHALARELDALTARQAMTLIARDWLETALAAEWGTSVADIRKRLADDVLPTGSVPR